MSPSFVRPARLLAPFSRPLHGIGPRLLRFGCTGGLAGAIQLMSLHLWVARGWDALVANIVAFLVAAQVNFLLSVTFTWADRRAIARSHETLLRRWVAFHGSITGTALLNQAAFAVDHVVLPTLLAASLGIAVAAVANFVMLDRFIFRMRAADASGGAS
jgi:putative flippase GtrA